MRLTRTEKELAAYVDRRLCEEDAAHLKPFMGMAAADRKSMAKTVYEARKRLARDGNRVPLQKHLVDLTGDPEIADFVAKPPARPWPKNKRRDLARDVGLRDAERAYITRIREIIRQKTDKRRVPHDLLVRICAEVLECQPNQIETRIKHGGG